MLDIIQHSSTSYAPRTFVNAKAADVTVALAVDFSTAGERLTKKAAGANYLALELPSQTLPKATRSQHAESIYLYLHALGRSNLNIAGNGIYTMAKAGYTQASLNWYMYRLLRAVHADIPIASIRSGGQSGIDTAGIVAAMALNIPATVCMPKFCLMRFEDGRDVRHTEAQVRRLLDSYLDQLLS